MNSMYDDPNIQAIQNDEHLFDNEKCRIIAILLDYKQQYEKMGLSVDVKLLSFSTSDVQMYRTKKEDGTGSELTIKYTLKLNLEIKIHDLTEKMLTIAKLFYPEASDIIKLTHELEVYGIYQSISIKQWHEVVNTVNTKENK